MKVSVYSYEGKETTARTLSDSVFGTKAGDALIRQSFLREAANRRRSIAHTLTKGEVRGGGRKPYKQKGTGNARQGSITNPHYIGGGVAFGPRSDRNFSQKINRKQVRLALLGALSRRAAEGMIFILDSFAETTPKTKTFIEFMSKIPVKRRLLLISHEKNEALEKSIRNVPSVKFLLLSNLNITDILHHDTIVFLDRAVTDLEEMYKTQDESSH